MLDYDIENPFEKRAPLHALLLLGQAYRISNQIYLAQKVFLSILDTMPASDLPTRNIVARELKVCQNANYFLDHPVKATVQNLGQSINNRGSSFNPVVASTSGEMFYMQAFKFYDGIMQAMPSDSLWKNAKNITMKIGSDGDYYITGATADGKQLFFRLFNVMTENDLYESHLQGEKWTTPSLMPDVFNSGYVETHLSVSSDGRQAYFTSNRLGGYGGLDIYTSTKAENGEWSVPRNLGPLVNSPMNEETPFVSANGNVLYFSSEGHNSMGGYDVFRASWADTGWSKPLNLGYPLNTTDDNLFYAPVGTGDKSLLISKFDSEGFGEKDLFLVKDYEILTNQDIEYILPETLLLSLQTKLPPAENDSVDRANTSFQGQGHTANNKPGSNNNAPAIADTIILANVYFSDNKYYLNYEDINYLKYLAGKLNQHMLYNIKLIGYAHEPATTEYHKNLAKNRASMVRNYLMLQGIPKQAFSITQENQTAQDKKMETNPYTRRTEVYLENIPANIKTIRTDKFLLPY
ncbi:MAG: OmpA family protein [Bacteroidales bacterium]|nr:OmpA family protein [Bacteroidales bacterium]